MQAIQLERDIRKEIKDFLINSGWFVYYNLAGMYSYKGLSDLVAIKERPHQDAFVLFLEIKRNGGIQSEDQKKFQKNLDNKNAHYLIARSIDDLVEYLEKNDILTDYQAKIF